MNVSITRKKALIIGAIIVACAVVVTILVITLGSCSANKTAAPKTTDKETHLSVIAFNGESTISIACLYDKSTN